MWKMMVLTSGFIITSWGLVFNIISLSYFDMGYDIVAFFTIILTKFETYFTPIGLLLIFLSLKKKRKH